MCLSPLNYMYVLHRWLMEWTDNLDACVDRIKYVMKPCSHDTVGEYGCVVSDDIPPTYFLLGEPRKTRTFLVWVTLEMLLISG